MKTWHKVYLKDYPFDGSETVLYQWNLKGMKWFSTSGFQPTIVALNPI